jgi:SAM-dependent methyltransferase
MSSTHPPLASPRPSAPPPPEAAWRALLGSSAAPYRAAGRFAWHFALGKLGRDPVFRALLERGELAERGRVVDIGCGQGLLASLLDACNRARAAQTWPSAWPAAPHTQQYTGIELMPRDVARAERAVAHLALAPRFICGDMCTTALPACDLVVILDVLHYVDHAAQAEVLARVKQALAPRGRLLLRVGDQADRRGFAISQWVDRVVTRIRGHQVAPTWGRSVAAWCALLQGEGFAVRTLPMSSGTPFANVLLIADLAASPTTGSGATP